MRQFWRSVCFTLGILTLLVPQHAGAQPTRSVLQKETPALQVVIPAGIVCASENCARSLASAFGKSDRNGWYLYSILAAPKRYATLHTWRLPVYQTEIVLPDPKSSRVVLKAEEGSAPYFEVWGYIGKIKVAHYIVPTNRKPIWEFGFRKMTPNNGSTVRTLVATGK